MVNIPLSQLHSYLQMFKAFQGIQTDIIKEIEDEIQLIELPAGEVLFHKDAEGDSMALIISGDLAVKIILPDGAETIINHLVSGDTVGESSLLLGHKRSATVAAFKDSKLIKLSKIGFEGLLQNQRDIRNRLENIIRPRLLHSYLAQAILNLFPEMDSATLNDFRSHLTWLDLRGGDILFREGDPSDAIYFVVYGRLQYFYESEPDRPLDELSAGSSIGEIGLVTGLPRSASARAVRDSLVVRLNKQDFQQLAHRTPNIVMQLARQVIIQNNPANPARMADDRRTMNIMVLANSPEVPIDAFTRGLEDALNRVAGSTCRMSPEVITDAFGRADIVQSENDCLDDLCFQAWLSEQEQFYRYILYIPDAALTSQGRFSAWTQRCLRQADMILVVAQAGTNAKLTPVEEVLKNANIKTALELVLIHPENTNRPKKTQDWLLLRSVSAHHHIRLHASEDFASIARRITGKGLGLVLSGGAARGYAHVGAYRALLEHGLQIDMIGGASMGSILGAMFALQLSDAEIMEIVKALSSSRKLFDPTLPLVSFFASQKINHVLQYIFGDTQIEDLWRPYFCVSNNLARASQVIHRSGLVWKAVRASSALPGVFSPMPYQGELLVDGGVLNNLPIDVMRDMLHNGPIIAVNVIPDVDLVLEYEMETSVSGWEVIWSRINPFGKPLQVPWIFENLLRVISLNEVAQAHSKKNLADLYITPPVGHFKILEFSAYQPIIDIGYQTTCQALANWKQPG